MNRKGIIIFAIIAVLLFASIGGCTQDSEYTRAGKEFDSWINTDPSRWSDTQKDYFNDLMDWVDKN